MFGNSVNNGDDDFLTILPDWMLIFELIVVVSAVGNGVLGGRVVLERALQDQVSGATGFVYRTDTNGPTSYVQYSTGHGGANFGYPSVTLPHTELQQLHTVPLASIYPAAVASLLYPGLAVQDHQFDQDSQIYNGVGDGVSQGSEFSKGVGSESNSGHEAASGEKGEKGYKTVHHYAKGNEGKHNEEGHKGNYNKGGGEKRTNHDSAEHYDKQQSSGDSRKGGSFSEASSHKKGSKTTGFHKVYHKDEYKKDHTFYDESDSSGQSDKYSGNHAEHSAEDGGNKKTEHSDSAFSKMDQGKSGYYDGGKYNNENSGHKASEGDDNYHANKSDYRRNGEESSDKKFGYNYGHGDGDYEKYSK